MSPTARGDRLFWLRQEPGQEHPVLVVADHPGARERVLLDPYRLDPSGRTVLDAWHPSVEGGLLACQVSRDGTEDSVLQVIDVATGAPVDGPVDRVRASSVGWLPGGEAFYYVRRRAGEDRYHRRVWLHRVGTDAGGDALVFGEGRDRTRFYSLAVTPDGRWLIVTATLGTSRGTDLYLADLTAGPLDRPRLRTVQEGTGDRTRLHVPPGTRPGDPVWLRTDRGAPRGRVVACRTDELERGPVAWREVIAERPNAVLTRLVVLGGPGDRDGTRALAAWTRHSVAEVTAHDLTGALGGGVGGGGLDGGGVDRGGGVVPLTLPGAGAVGDISPGPHGSYGSWFAYTDFVTPPRMLYADARTGRVTRWERDVADVPPPGRGGGAVSGGAVSGGAVSRQVAFPSRDGTTVRMFVISPTGRPDVPRPVLLTGYGGFGATMSPRYRSLVLAWVRAGGVFAWPGLRGGGEEGEEWHRAGSGPHKQNTFDDFFAATDHLVEAGWTTPGRVAVMGGSNGGLLVAAALTQRPAAYAAVVCTAPLLDMVRYELSGLGPSWVPEYGSVRDPGQFRTLLGYSPYHRVTPGTPYPAVLLCAADGDTRTDPLHARKMCAALQHATTGTGPVLLRLERGVGHGDRSASRALALQADALAFLAAGVGLAAPGEGAEAVEANGGRAGEAYEGPASGAGGVAGSGGAGVPASGVPASGGEVR
jgi:prolyl oligopeptidase